MAMIQEFFGEQREEGGGGEKGGTGVPCQRLTKWNYGEQIDTARLRFSMAGSDQNSAFAAYLCHGKICLTQNEHDHLTGDEL